MNETVIPTLFFYLLSGLSVLTALAVVLDHRLLRSAVALIVVLSCGAGFAILLGYELIAGVQLLVFVGGIVVLLVYAIMMTSDGNQFEVKPLPWRRTAAATASLAFFALTMRALYATRFVIKTDAHPVDEVHAVGRLLLSNHVNGYIVPFELISLLLLAALIGGIVVARKHIHEEKGQQGHD